MSLHPKAQIFINQLAEQDGPGWQDMPVAESRAVFSSLKGIFGTGPELAKIEVMRMSDVPVRVYRPTLEPKLPVVVFFHGGGFVLGDLDTHDAMCRRLSRTSGCVVVAVDYRLAPDHKFPAAHDDCFAVTKYVSEHADDLAVDAKRLIVTGDSAGGNLAATVCVRARDEKGPTICGQVLIYPVIEPNFETTSYQTFGTGHGLTRDSMRWFWQQYIDNTKTSTPAENPYAVPNKADVVGLPPAHVIVAEYDVLRDEGLDYASRLQSAGVSSSTKQYDGMLHGFVHFAGFFEDGVTATQDIGDVIRRMVA